MLRKIKKVVCLGGGGAMPSAVLAGLKKYPNEISAICATLDSGGSSGRLRRDYKITSPGDIRRAFIILANTSPIVENLFDYRFQAGSLAGHNFANLSVVALQSVTQDYGKTFNELARFLNLDKRHQVLPATIDNVNLCAILENGKTIIGETNIDVPKHNDKLKIKKVFLKPTAKAFPKAIEAIDMADLIVFGPGDLYSSLIQILLAEGMPQAIRKSKAKKVYLCNLMTKRGETNNFSVLDFTREIEKYLRSEVDYVIYNNFIPRKEIIKNYKREHPELLDLVKIDRGLPKTKFIGKKLLLKNLIKHDSKKIAKILLKIALC